ncbi:MAG: hypothetical protein ACI36Y_09385 [Coriobacteriales bacterium]
MVTHPIDGGMHKGYILGYSSLGLEHMLPECFTEWNSGSRVERREFGSYGEMREHFDGTVEELREQGLLRRAWVIKDGKPVFSWHLED